LSVATVTGWGIVVAAAGAAIVDGRYWYGKVVILFVIIEIYHIPERAQMQRIKDFS
jgi:hypothetical protein